MDLKVVTQSQKGNKFFFRLWDQPKGSMDGGLILGEKQEERIKQRENENTKKNLQKKTPQQGKKSENERKMDQNFNNGNQPDHFL